MAEPNHLDIEGPQFRNVPHIWIQWKGTDVCCDIHCECGAFIHFDGDFMYFIKCPECEKYWEIGTSVRMYPATKAAAENHCCQYPQADREMEPKV